jgi:hypothetical protein
VLFRILATTTSVERIQDQDTSEFILGVAAVCEEPAQRDFAACKTASRIVVD